MIGDREQVSGRERGTAEDDENRDKGAQRKRKNQQMETEIEKRKNWDHDNLLQSTYSIHRSQEIIAKQSQCLVWAMWLLLQFSLDR